MDCAIFWKEQEELGALVMADATTSKAANNLLIGNSACIASTVAKDFEFSPVNPNTFLRKRRYQETLVSSNCSIVRSSYSIYNCYGQNESQPTPHPYDQTATAIAANAHHLPVDDSLSHTPSNSPSDHTTTTVDSSSHSSYNSRLNSRRNSAVSLSLEDRKEVVKQVSILAENDHGSNARRKKLMAVDRLYGKSGCNSIKRWIRKRYSNGYYYLHHFK